MQEKTGKRKVRAVMATKGISVGIVRVVCISAGCITCVNICVNEKVATNDVNRE